MKLKDFRPFHSARSAAAPSSRSLMGTVLVLASAMLLSGCLSMFGLDDGIDQELLEQTRYRRINTSCGGIDLANSQLSTGAFRGIVDCFNANGAIEPMAAMVRALTDEELAPIVELINRSALSDPKLLFDLEQTYDELDRNGLLAPTFERVGLILENDEFVTSGIALLRSAQMRSAEDQLPFKVLARISEHLTDARAGGMLEGARTVLESSAANALLERVRYPSPGRSRDLRDEFVQPLWDLLDERAREGEAAPNLSKTVADLMVSGKIFKVADLLMGAQADELRRNVPRFAAAMRTITRREARIDGTETDAATLDDLFSLFTYSKSEISCLKGSQSVPQASLFIIRELVDRSTGDKAKEFYQRVIPATLPALNAFCTYPTELATYYPALYRLSETDAIGPLTELLRQVWKEGMVDELLLILSDTGQGEDRNAGGLRRLLPLANELADRGAWDDVLYAVTMLTDDQRAQIVDWLKFASEAAPSLGDASLMDSSFELLRRADPVQVVRFLRSLQIWIASDSDFLRPGIAQLRDAYHLNDVHPFIELSRLVMRESAKSPRLADSLLRLSELQEFPSVVRLVSEMAKDGRLKELVSASTHLFHNFAATGAHEIRTLPVPPFRPFRRHDWSSRWVPPLAAEPGAIRPDDRCATLNLSMRLQDTRGEDFEKNFDQYVECLMQGRNDDRQVTDLFRFLTTERVSGDRTVFEIQVDLLTELGERLDAPDMKELSDAFIRSVDDGRMFRVMESLQYFATERLPAVSVSSVGTLISPLLETVRSVVQSARMPLRRVLEATAEGVRSAEFPAAFRYVRERLAAAEDCIDPVTGSKCHDPAPSARPGISASTLGELREALREQACVRDPLQVEARVESALEDYERSVTSYDLDPRTGDAHFSWTREDLVSALVPIVRKYRDPGIHASNKDPLASTVNLLKYFTLPADPALGWGPNRPDATSERHYAPEYLAQWLSERSFDPKPILYFYPGEKTPRVRLVSSLDRLELVLYNADIQFLLPDNFGSKFLQLIAEAWGDEPHRAWPEEIRRRFPQGETCDNPPDEETRLKWVRRKLCPMKLVDAYRNDSAFPRSSALKSMAQTLRNFEFLLGFPETPVCDGQKRRRGEDVAPATASGSSGLEIIPFDVRARVFNIRQLVSVIEDNLPGAAGPQAGGMKVLRDLFWEMLSSSPEQCRDPGAGECNNLSIVSMVVKTGMIHRLSQVLREFPMITRESQASTEEEELRREQLLDFFRAIGDFADHPQSKRLMQALAGKVERSGRVETDAQVIAGAPLFFRVVEELFEAFEAADGGPLSLSRQLEWERAGSGGAQELRLLWNDEARRIKQLGFHSVLLLRKTGLIPVLMPVILRVIERDQRTLASNPRVIEAVFRSTLVSRVVRAISEEPANRHGPLVSLVSRLVDNPSIGSDAVEILGAVVSKYRDERVPTPVGLALERWDSLQNLYAFRKLKVDEVLGDILDYFFEETGGGDGEWTGSLAVRSGASARLREFLADRMEPKDYGARPGDLEELLVLVGRYPERIEEMLSTVARYSARGGELQSFISMARRSLALPKD